MANKETENCEKFKTMIGGQALIEGIMMRGPEKDAIVIRGKDGLTVEVSPRKLNPPDSWKNWPFIRGIFNFFDAQIVGVKALLAIFPGLETIRGTFGYRMLMIVFKLLLLPVVVGITYEINRWCGRNGNAFTRALSAPGMWMQHFTTNEPDDSMIEVGIAAVQAVLPEKEGSDRW